MRDIIKKTVFYLLAALMLLSTACAYSGVASQSGKLWVPRNDTFLFGALRKIYVCNEEGKKMVCQEAGKP